ncbi:PadR family transcriptional regulator [Fulvitalea axinellae]|uniref:PadR family transcriptional regulator n=1 Tax=Fulvitalea axinellae TaxID=1182444 RepID=A0AAU9CU36_9BACT|nr:PadR family transcriptional regulator [Fulvitalea axinellae]
MNIENVKIQMKKGILEFCVLHIISRGEVYASSLISELKDADFMVVEGTLYPLLNRLRKAGLLDYKWVESDSGPPRKYYSLTATGFELLEQMNETWQGIERSANLIINNDKNKPS